MIANADVTTVLDSLITHQ